MSMLYKGRLLSGIRVPAAKKHVNHRVSHKRDASCDIPYNSDCALNHGIHNSKGSAFNDRRGYADRLPAIEGYVDPEVIQDRQTPIHDGVHYLRDTAARNVI